MVFLKSWVEVNLVLFLLWNLIFVVKKAAAWNLVAKLLLGLKCGKSGYAFLSMEMLLTVLLIDIENAIFLDYEMLSEEISHDADEDGEEYTEYKITIQKRSNDKKD